MSMQHLGKKHSPCIFSLQLDIECNLIHSKIMQCGKQPESKSESMSTKK